MTYVVHQAGLYLDKVQRCVRCGEVLADGRDEAFVAAVAEASSAPVERHWEHGAEIGVRDGRFWFAIHPSKLDAFDVAARCRPPLPPARTTESR